MNCEVELQKRNYNTQTKIFQTFSTVRPLQPAVRRSMRSHKTPHLLPPILCNPIEFACSIRSHKIAVVFLEHSIVSARTLPKESFWRCVRRLLLSFSSSSLVFDLPLPPSFGALSSPPCCRCVRGSLKSIFVVFAPQLVVDPH